MSSESSKWSIYRPLVVIAVLVIMFVYLIYVLTSDEGIFFLTSFMLEVITEGINMTVDVVGIVVFLLGLFLYFGIKGRRAVFLFISGIGAGMVIAAVWFTVQIQMM